MSRSQVVLLPPMHVVLLVLLHWLEYGQSESVFKPALSFPHGVAVPKGEGVSTNYIVPAEVGADVVPAHLHQGVST